MISVLLRRAETKGNAMSDKDTVNTGETASEALYYEMSVLMVKFLASLYWHSGAIDFIEDNCKPLFNEFEETIKEIRERSPDLYKEIRNE